MLTKISILLDKIMPVWVTTSFPIFRTILIAIIGLCSISLIITTLMQSNASSDGMSALSGGGQESYYSQNKGQSRDGRLKKLTIIAASIIAGCIILFFISLLIYNPTV